MNIFRTDEIQNMLIHGRTSSIKYPLTLFWTASGIELNVKASELWINFKAEYLVYEPWISIEINGVIMSRLMLNKGTNRICIFRGMNPDKIKNVRIYKDTQALSEDSSHCLQIFTLETDGEFCAVEERKLKLEFIGDSITSGEGAIGAKSEEDWIMMFFSATRNYSYYTAKALNADYRCISQSGWGVLTSWDNDRKRALPKYYEQCCGTLKGRRNIKAGAHELNDFESWQPDFIICNLGTNDASGFEIEGKTNKRLKDIEKAVLNFIIKLRKLNKKAYIIWVYGMLGDTLEKSIRNTVEIYKKQYDDSNVSFMMLQNTDLETVGARQHPGEAAHKNAADRLIPFISEKVNNLVKK